MLGIDRLSLRAIYGCAAFTILLAGCSSLAGAPTQSSLPETGRTLREQPAKVSQDLYIGNILGGVLLYSTGKNQHEVGDISDQLPRVTSVWVDQTGILYAFSDNRQYPYETIEEFKPGSTTPFFSLVLQHYGLIVAADAAQNVYAQGANGQGQPVIDVYPPGSQNYANEYVVPAIGKRLSAPEGMAFDSSGALLVGVVALANNRQGQIGQVFRLSAGSSTFVSLKLKKAFGGLIATDGAGNLYVGGGKLISVYAPGATSPSYIVHAPDTVVTLTAASDGTLYVAAGSGITVYPPGKKQSNHSFVPPAQVSGLALGPE
jgi:hypothetical protein